MPELTFFTAFALIFGGTAAHVILKLVVTTPAVLTRVGVALVRVCKNIQCQSGSHRAAAVGTVLQLLKHPE